MSSVSRRNKGPAVYGRRNRGYGQKITQHSLSEILSDSSFGSSSSSSCSESADEDVGKENTSSPPAKAAAAAAAAVTKSGGDFMAVIDANAQRSVLTQRNKPRVQCVVNRAASRKDVIEGGKREKDEEDEVEHLVTSIEALKVTKSRARRGGRIASSSRRKAQVSPRQEQELGLLLSVCQPQKLAPQPFDALLDELESRCSEPSWFKVGEASYSEVFRLSSSKHVLKVIPIQAADPVPDRNETLLPEESDICDVRREVQMTSRLSRIHPGFVALKSSHVVKGRYPDRLLRSWSRFADEKEDCENICPRVFGPSQLYAVLILAEGGPDLEHAKLTNWCQASSIFWQVADALAAAEEACQFEHRDLHWGNVLVASARRGKSTAVRATIIDFTLSRAAFDSKVTSHTFQDQEVFEGQGDLQFEVYRQMKIATKGRWESSCLQTNVMWLGYLLDKLLRAKGLRAPRKATKNERSYQSLVSVGLHLNDCTSAKEVVERCRDAAAC